MIINVLLNVLRPEDLSSQVINSMPHYKGLLQIIIQLMYINFSMET